MQSKRRFTHVPNFTGYMQRVLQHVCQQLGQPNGQRVLDVPAGNGLLVDAMQEVGYDALGGDINAEREDYISVDMERQFPFEDDSFDAVTCLEGIEHVMSPAKLVNEIARVSKPGAVIVISTPNTMSMYSRCVSLIHGVPYQFLPNCRTHPAHGACEDRGHIWPVSYPILRYLLQEHGCDVVAVDGDKFKKKWLMPLFLFPLLFNWICSRGAAYRARSSNQEELDTIRKHVLSRRLLFSRSLIVVARKKAGDLVKDES